VGKHLGISNVTGANIWKPGAQDVGQRCAEFDGECNADEESSDWF